MGNDTNETNGNPFADRLDRSYFGFDQDYYERMPLLVNAMQESSYTDPSVDSTPLKHKARYVITNYTKPTRTTTSQYNYMPSSIRRTSPRPFIYEYKSPTPAPFSKTYGSKSWIEGYRNAQRLQNLKQVIQYLEKTINAKFGDMYALPTSTHIAFSGVYVEPMTENVKQTGKDTPTLETLAKSSNKVESRYNHQADPLFSFKPESPGDVNLLADGFFRFSPTPSESFNKEKTSYRPMFRSISNRKRPCIGIKCNENNEEKVVNLHASGEIRNTEEISPEKPKSFSVMLNLFPITPTDTNYRGMEAPKSTQQAPKRVFITTSRPIVQFRRKSTTPIRRTTTRYKRPRLLFTTRKSSKSVISNNLRSDEKHDAAPKMIVHVNLYPSPEAKAIETSTTKANIFTTQANHRIIVTEMPMLNSTQVEDYHLGSSGIIPPEARLTPAPPPPLPTIPIQTTTLPFDTLPSTTETNSWSTIPLDVIRFSHEDAKVPDHYQAILQANNIERVFKTDCDHTVQPEVNRRNSKDSVDYKEDYDESPRTLIVKLKNDLETTTKETISEEITTEGKEQSEEIPQTEETTVRTYVPQINGHYRNVNQNSKNINSWLNTNSDYVRKKRIEMSVTAFRKPTYVYVDIKRNNTRNSSDADE